MIKKILGRLFIYSAAVIAILGLMHVADRHHKLTPSELLEYSQDKIVVLNGPTNPNSGGTGFEAVAPSGKVYTITNKHVCGLAENGIMSAQTKYHERTVLLRILEVSSEHDLCILEGIPNVVGYKVSPSEAKRSDKLYVIGHPKLAANTYQEGYFRERMDIELLDETSKTKEECLAKPRHSFKEVRFMIFMIEVCLESMDSIGTSVIIYGGNSGSPVFDENNYVIGVMFASNNDDHNGHYVPLEYLNRLLARY